MDKVGVVAAAAKGQVPVLRRRSAGRQGHLHGLPLGLEHQMIDVLAWLKGKEIVIDGRGVSFPDGREAASKAVAALLARIKRFVTPKACPHCDCKIDFENPRSTPQLRRYFAMIRAFYTHWPEYHPEQFDDEKNFRYWLQMKSGAEYRFEKGSHSPCRCSARQSLDDGQGRDDGKRGLCISDRL
jgi:hypothetical protein